MLRSVAILFLVLWVLAKFVFSVGGALIHLLLVVAVIVVLDRFFTRRKVV